MKFITRIYHPNIDPGGRVCLDLLNSAHSKHGECHLRSVACTSRRVSGAWTPTTKLLHVMAGVRTLLAEPNADDGLVAEIVRRRPNRRVALAHCLLNSFQSSEYKNARSLFDEKARQMTRQWAMDREEGAVAAPAAAREEPSAKRSADEAAASDAPQAGAASSGGAAAAAPLEEGDAVDADADALLVEEAPPPKKVNRLAGRRPPAA